MSDKPTLLCIDDEERVLRSLKLLFQDTHTVYTTTAAAEYEQILATKDINVVICDQRMPDCLGTELLELTVKLSPKTMRILLTGYADLADVMDAVNKGEIFRYVTKPWDLRDLRETVEQATALSFVESLPETSDAVADTLTVEKKTSVAGAADGEEKQKGHLLIVTDDELHRQKLHDVLGDDYELYDATSLSEAQEKMSSLDISVLITEMTLDGKLTAECISKLKVEHPAVVSIILTDLEDSSALIDLINTGQIYRCLPKSVTGKMLQNNVSRAVMRHAQLQANPIVQQRYQVEAPKPTVERRSLLGGLFGRRT